MSTRQWKIDNPDKLKEYKRRYNDKFPSRNTEQVKKHRKRVRLEVLTHYSCGIPHCVCCNESLLEFLCIDHINGGGTSHNKKTGVNIYAWLKKNSYPLGFRVLCHNCNSALGFYGYCPHPQCKKEYVNATTT